MPTETLSDGGRTGFGKEWIISTGLSLILVVVLVLANGFFVATEFALVSVRRTRIQQLASEGDRRAKRLLSRLEHLDTYIAATQLGITISSLGLGWIGEPAIARLLQPLVAYLPFDAFQPGTKLYQTAAFTIAFSIVTALHIVLGELAPKSLALQRPESTSLFAAGPIHWFLILFKPVIVALNAIGNWVVRLFGIEPAAGHTLVHSPEELKLAIEASREAGVVPQTTEELVYRAFTFTDLGVRHVMVPRTEMTTVPIDVSLEALIRTAAESKHMRLPVYDGHHENIVGVISVKAVLDLLSEEASSLGLDAKDRHDGTGFDVRQFMAEPLMVPESISAAEVLTRLREAHTQIALVIDEYGGIAGLVTLQDLVDSLVGEIEDERHPGEPQISVETDGPLVLDGLTTLYEARERYGLDLPQDRYDVETLGGYVFSALGRPAAVGDEVMTPAGRVLRVEAMDGLRVARVSLISSPQRQPAEATTTQAVS